MRQYRKMVSASAEFDAQTVKDTIAADKGEQGLDEILNLLCNRGNQSRQNIKRAYRFRYKEEMQDNIEKAYKGCDSILSALLNLPEDYDAKELYKSMKGLGTKEATLTEIMCSRNNQEIRDASYAYRHWYGQSLKEDIVGDTSGEYRNILVGLCAANRDESNAMDQAGATYAAKVLNDKKAEDGNFTQVLTTYAYPQLRLVFEEYKKLTGKDFEDGVKKEYGGDAEIAAFSLIKVAKNKSEYFADLVHDSVKKGSIDVALRICGSREDKDLHDIKQTFLNKYHTPMDNFVADYIKDKKSFKGRDVVLAMIRNAN